MSRNKIFAAVALIIGLILVVVVFTDFPPEDSNIAGTMADPEKKIAGAEPADRYSSEQITDADVELDDATFQILMQDDDFVAIVNSGDLAATLELAVTMARLDKVGQLEKEDQLGKAVKDLGKATVGEKVSLGERIMTTAKRVTQDGKVGGKSVQQMEATLTDELGKITKFGREDVERLSKILLKVDPENFERIARIVDNRELQGKTFTGREVQGEGFDRAQWAETFERANRRLNTERANSGEATDARKTAAGERVKK